MGFVATTERAAVWTALERGGGTWLTVLCTDLLELVLTHLDAHAAARRIQASLRGYAQRFSEMKFLYGTALLERHARLRGSHLSMRRAESLHAARFAIYRAHLLRATDLI